MKHLVLQCRSVMLAAFILVSCAINAQNSGTANTDSAQYFQRAATAADTSALIEEKLVQLALQRPLYKEAEYEKRITEHELTKAKNSWLDLLSISANYNDQTFAPKSANAQYVYPKYFFGLSIPLGLIFNRGGDIKIAKDKVNASVGKQDELARSIKADILTKYRQYRTYGQLLALQNQVIDDEQAAFLQAEQKFKDGTITIESFNTASKNYNAEVVKRIDLQLQQDLVKIEIERMIGMRLEDALKFNTRDKM